MNTPHDFSLTAQLRAAAADLAGRGSRRWAEMGVTKHEAEHRSSARSAAPRARPDTGAPATKTTKPAPHPGCTGRAKASVTKTVMRMLRSGQFPDGITTLDVRRAMPDINSNWITTVMGNLAARRGLVRANELRDKCRYVFRLPEEKNEQG
jgi:hypothetical protein